MTQLNIYDEARGTFKPELTRQQRIDRLLEMADSRDKEAKFWHDHGNSLRATHLNQCAQGDRSLAAMLRR